MFFGRGTVFGPATKQQTTGGTKGGTFWVRCWVFSPWRVPRPIGSGDPTVAASARGAAPKTEELMVTVMAARLLEHTPWRRGQRMKGFANIKRRSKLNTGSVRHGEKRPHMLINHHAPCVLCTYSMGEVSLVVLWSWFQHASTRAFGSLASSVCWGTSL